MAQDNNSIAVIQRVIDELFNEGKLDVADEVFAPHFKSHAWWHNAVEMASGEPVPASGPGDSTPETEKEGVSYWRERFPDARWQLDEILPTQDPNKIVTLWTGTGTSTAGKAYTIKGIDIYRLEDGKIAEYWTSWDRLGFWQQMGFVPSTAELRGMADRAQP